MSDERGFEVVDRRRVYADSESPEPDAAAAAPGETANAEGGGDAGLGLGAITVTGVLQWTFGILAERAWVCLGLVPDPMTGQMHRDMSEAKRAIDVVADLGKHLSSVANSDQQREIQSMISDLRINYVRQSVP
jgi:hypothetical protein